MSENMVVAVEEPPLRSAPSVPPPTPYVFQSPPPPPARTPVFVWGLAAVGALLFLIIYGTPFLVRSMLNSPEGRWHELKVTGNDYLVKKDFKTAERYYRASLAEADKMGPRDWHAAMSLFNLSLAVADEGRYKDAEPLAVEALALQRRMPSPEEGDLYLNLTGLGWIEYREGKFAQAVPLYQEAIPLESTYPLLKPEHRFWNEYFLGTALQKCRRQPEARAALQQAQLLATDSEDGNRARAALERLR